MNTETNKENNTQIEALEIIKKLLGNLQDAYTMMILTASMLDSTANDIKNTVKEVGITVIE